jgi:hypothetical protein
MTGYLCGALVGLVFLLSGALKALDAGAFLKQVRRYRLLPRGWEQPASLTFIGLECGLGAALLTGWPPALPVAAVVLVFFAALTAWGTSSGRVEDCGCYGGLVLLTPAQSIALDGVYIALLAVSWVLGPAVSMPLWWRAGAVAAVVVAGIAMAARSVEKPIADLALLRVSRPWRRNWLKGYERDLSRGAHFVVFLSRDCPYCKRWVPLLNVIEVRPEMPSVVGVMSLQGEQLEGFLGEHLIRFPIAHMPQSLVSLMVNAYPTAALVEDGRIRQKWVGEMPKDYLEKVRQFFEVVAAPRKGASTFGG